MDIFNRGQAPFGAEIWAVIDREVKEVLTGRMIGRRIVDVEGPLGLTFSSLGTGNTLPLEGEKGTVVLRQNIPVAELRFPFRVSKEDVARIIRGAEGPDDPDSLRTAAVNLAEAEDRIIFRGLPGTQIAGLLPGAAKSPAAPSAETLPKTIITLIETMHRQKVDGPFALLLGETLYAELFASSGYPLSMKIEQILGTGGKILLAPFLKESYALISLRGGDFRLILGVDTGVGYTGESETHYDLFIFETCTFRVVTAEACAVSQK
jgi:uncharacterized linocin/CFP29 family protein